MTSMSLRLRLTAIILLPLMLIALAVGVWQVRNARATAADLFDRSLLSLALAVSGDVARSDGGAVSLQTRDLLADTSGGRVFYHVYAPDGAFVIGYATPPVPVNLRPPDGDAPAYYNARYLGRDVRVLRLRDVTSIGGLSGTFTITVWQDVDVRQQFVRDLATRTFVVIAALIGTVALVVWFGVNLGLRPLLDLEEAISRRSSDDLSPIRRAVPTEARGIVGTLNQLLAQVSSAMQTQGDFISNAAHQLRNPIAGVLAMAEAVRSAPTGQAARQRADDLVLAARSASDLANKLLTLERAKSSTVSEPFDLRTVVGAAVAGAAAQAEARGVSLNADMPEAPVTVLADALMVQEAALNLIDNALRHAGPDLSRIDVSVVSDTVARLRISDDGAGANPEDFGTIMSRFGQAVPGQGSGLGLSIADTVAQRHGGSLTILSPEVGFSVEMRLPLHRR